VPCANLADVLTMPNQWNPHAWLLRLGRQRHSSSSHHACCICHTEVARSAPLHSSTPHMRCSMLDACWHVMACCESGLHALAGASWQLLEGSMHVLPCARDMACCILAGTGTTGLPLGQISRNVTPLLYWGGISRNVTPSLYWGGISRNVTPSLYWGGISRNAGPAQEPQRAHWHAMGAFGTHWHASERAGIERAVCMGAPSNCTWWLVLTATKGHTPRGAAQHSLPLKLAPCRSADNTHPAQLNSQLTAGYSDNSQLTTDSSQLATHSSVQPVINTSRGTGQHPASASSSRHWQPAQPNCRSSTALGCTALPHSAPSTQHPPFTATSLMSS
jgi:hypothetical protein